MPRKATVLTLAAVLILGGAFGLCWFAPWKLFTNTTVRESVSVPVAPPSAPVATSAPTGPVLVAGGTFTSGEHETTGTARVVREPDGSRRLELVGLATSDGPDLRVWLTDGAARPGRHVELGRLKGNRGDQVYAIPGGTDISGLRQVNIWCIRFSVSFGAADLRTA